MGWKAISKQAILDCHLNFLEVSGPDPVVFNKIGVQPLTTGKPWLGTWQLRSDCEAHGDLWGHGTMVRDGFDEKMV